MIELRKVPIHKVSVQNITFVNHFYLFCLKTESASDQPIRRWRYNGLGAMQLGSYSHQTFCVTALNNEEEFCLTTLTLG